MRTALFSPIGLQSTGTAPAGWHGQRIGRADRLAARRVHVQRPEKATLP